MFFDVLDFLTGWLSGQKQRSAKPYNRGFESHTRLILSRNSVRLEYFADNEEVVGSNPTETTIR